MKIKVEKIKVDVYGKRSNFRFSFTFKFHPSYDIQKDIKIMIREASKEAKQIFRESRRIHKARYGGMLENIVWLKFDNGLFVEVM